ncbi:DUF2383 domain-containing protein [Paraliomyxa miuraensis]|uniref:DUF2383 domain-containing protein n=1 Tax=Paraliomyxa miuraensis TaxID=376150 RepID=UPI00225932F3|nr:DUF2383 domain-containing protein [Paraliomyxa miuraensis]MCX4243411.1 PA2169 family four-helix-bundle protein [Paraliomyxa miuraensis]
MGTNDEKDINKLNSFLRGEISAVEAYDQCIEAMKDATVVAQLRKLKASHEYRVGQLTQRIQALGGQPAKGSGAWGSIVKLVEGGAKAFGESAAISALEEGEDHGKKDYADLSDLSMASRDFVNRVLVPEQQRTHDILSQLQHRV